MRAGSCVNRLHLPLALLVLLFAGVGCSSGGGVSQPVMTGLNGQGGNSPQVIDSGREPGRFDPTGHSLWGFYRIRVDPTRDVTEIVPVRDASIHWNVLKWLEQGPCTTCLKITKAVPSGNGTVLIDIQIKHPFPNPNLTGFDVRGIAMFAGSWQFLTKAVPDRLQGDGELVNADGFTALYNTYTEGEGPDGMQGYVEGKMAHHFYWLATLNGFKRHVSDDPENTRNAFYAGDSVTATYEIDMPDDPLMFEFGYAVDASWATPLVKPVTDPMTDFGPDANCP